jgi:hypothetical protein
VTREELVSETEDRLRARPGDLRERGNRLEMFLPGRGWIDITESVPDIVHGEEWVDEPRTTD